MGFEYLRYKRNEQLAKSLFEKSLQHINEESYSLQAHDAHIEVARTPVKNLDFAKKKRERDPLLSVPRT